MTSRNHTLQGRWRRAVLVLGAVGAGGAILAACSGVSPKLGSPTTTTTSSTAPPTTTTAPSSASNTAHVSVYFARGSSLGVASTDVAAKSVRFDTMQALFGGPSSTAQAAGLSTAIPSGSKVEGLSFSGSLAYVDLNGQFFASTTAATFRLRVAQIVYTLTQFSGLSEVQLYLHGLALPNIDTLPTARPLTRGDLAGAISDVLLETPAVGDAVSSPISISGISEISGTIEIQVVNGAGKLVVSTIATTVVGETFNYAYPFTSSDNGSGTVRIFAAPNRSTSSQLVASIPVTLDS